jgi:hypothetical protein
MFAYAWDGNPLAQKVCVTDDLVGVAMWDPPGEGEISTMKNRRFYERRGFEQASEILLRGGPDTWWLRRAPKGMDTK